MNNLLKKVYKSLPKRALYLDLGSGFNKDVIAMRKKGFLAYGVDKNNLNAEHIIRIEKFNITQDYYHLISAFYSLHFIPRESQLNIIADIKNKLAPNGYFVYDDFHGFSVEELKELFKDWDIILLEKKIILDWRHKGTRYPHFHSCVRLIARK